MQKFSPGEIRTLACFNCGDIDNLVTFCSGMLSSSCSQSLISASHFRSVKIFSLLSVVFILR